MTGQIDGQEAARKRLKFRSWHRGTREMDLLMGRFADAMLDSCDETLLTAYEALLEENDPDIYDWVCGRAVPPGGSYLPALEALTKFHNEVSKSC
jgi:antitoxin CptB